MGTSANRAKAKRKTQKQRAAVQELAPIRSEFAAANLGDDRLTKRLQMIADAFGAAPGRSFPPMLGSAAAVEGGYRFFNNKRVSLARVLEPHSTKTAERARACESVLVLHDGTNLVYSCEGDLRRGFGRFGNQQGIQALVSLAVSFEIGRASCRERV